MVNKSSIQQPYKTTIFLPVLLLLFLQVSGGGAVPWYFLPNFQHDVRWVQNVADHPSDFHKSLPAQARFLRFEDSGLTEEERRFVRWHDALFPHEDFMRLMPGRDMFGWYACAFDIPSNLSGLDVVMDLGIVDDSDETFVNGTFVGSMGKVPGGSAWRTDRRYRVPAELLRERGNVAAVHVWSRWGLGGIVGPPVLKAAVVPSDAKWDVAFVHGGFELHGLNVARTADEALAICFGPKTPEWQTADLPWKDYASLPDDVQVMAFRLCLGFMYKEKAPRKFDKPFVLDYGPVFDVAAFYLNGRRLGIVGRFPDGGEPAFTEAAQRARFIVEPKDLAVDGAVSIEMSCTASRNGTRSTCLFSARAYGADDCHHRKVGFIFAG